MVIVSRKKSQHLQSFDGKVVAWHNKRCHHPSFLANIYWRWGWGCYSQKFGAASPLLAHNAGRQGGRWVSSGATKGAITEPLPRLNETFIETIPQSRPGRDKMPRRWQQLPNVSGGGREGGLRQKRRGSDKELAASEW